MNLENRLELAIKRNYDAQALSDLLKEGADPNTIFNYGFGGYITAVAHCIKYNKIELLTVLLHDQRTEIGNENCFYEGGFHFSWGETKLDDFVKAQRNPEITALIKAARVRRERLEQRQAHQLKSLRFKI